MADQPHQDLSIEAGELPSPGRLLVEGRRRLKATREEVAAELNLSLDTVAAIEEDNYDDLPGPVFSRGYLRSYARLVSVDLETIISSDQYINMVAGKGTNVAHRLNRGKAKPQQPASSRIYIVFLVAVVFAVATWWFLQQPEGTVSESLSVESSSEIQLGKPEIKE